MADTSQCEYLMTRFFLALALVGWLSLGESEWFARTAKTASEGGNSPFSTK